VPEQAANFLTILAARARDVVAILAVLVPVWLFLSDNVKDWVAGVARSAFGTDIETMQVAVANVTTSIDTTNSRLAALELALAASTEPPLIFEDAGNSVSDGVIGGVVDLKFMAVKSRNCGRPSISVRFRDMGGFVHAFDTLGLLDDAGRGPGLPVRLAPQIVAFRARIPDDAAVEAGRAQAWLEFGSFETCPNAAPVRSPEIPFRITAAP
jgi:hypothetical protein